MQCMATVKGLRMSNKGASLTLDIALDDIGDIEGIQTLMGEWCEVTISPYQLSIDNIQVVNDGN